MERQQKEISESETVYEHTRMHTTKMQIKVSQDNLERMLVWYIALDPFDIDKEDEELADILEGYAETNINPTPCLSAFDESIKEDQGTQEMHDGKCPRCGEEDWYFTHDEENGCRFCGYVQNEYTGVGTPKSALPVNTGQEGFPLTWNIWMDKDRCETRQLHPDFNHWMCYYRNPPVPCTMGNCLKSINHYDKTKTVEHVGEGQSQEQPTADAGEDEKWPDGVIMVYEGTEYFIYLDEKIIEEGEGPAKITVQKGKKED